MFSPIRISNFDESYAVFDAFCEYAALQVRQIRKYAQRRDHTAKELMKDACKNLKSLLSVVKSSFSLKDANFIRNYARTFKNLH